MSGWRVHNIKRPPTACNFRYLKTSSTSSSSVFFMAKTTRFEEAYLQWGRSTIEDKYCGVEYTRKLDLSNAHKRWYGYIIYRCICTFACVQYIDIYKSLWHSQVSACPEVYDIYVYTTHWIKYVAPYAASTHTGALPVFIFSIHFLYFILFTSCFSFPSFSTSFSTLHLVFAHGFVASDFLSLNVCVRVHR